MKSTINALRSFEAVATTTETGETIFNPDNFLNIHNRVLDVKRNAKRQWGKMNLVQMLNHLTIATGSAINIYKLKDESSFLSRNFVKFLILRILKRLPKSAPSPDGFKTDKKILLQFDTEKEKVLNILEKAYSSSYNVYPHPSFGNMTRAEWGKLVYRHFDHHLRQFAS